MKKKNKKQDNLLESNLRDCLEYLIENEQEDFFDWCFVMNKSPSSEMRRKKHPHVYVSAYRVANALDLFKYIK